MFSAIMVYSILIIFLMYNSVLSLPSTLYTLRYMFYHLHSTHYILPATLLNLHSKSIYVHVLPLLSLIYALGSTIYPLSPSKLYFLCSTTTLFDLRSMIYDLNSKPICLEGYWSFLIFFQFLIF